MAESSALQSIDEHQLLQVCSKTNFLLSNYPNIDDKAALENPFEPTEVPLSPGASTASLSPSPTPSALAHPLEPTPSEAPPTEDYAWQTTYSAQVSEWRAQSASARTNAELARAKWEAFRAREKAERQALGRPPELWEGLGDHITASTAAASEVVTNSLSASITSFSSLEHVESRGKTEENAHRAVQHGKADNGSPSQRWEHLSSSPSSSYPSMSFPEASVPQSPSHQPVFLAPNSTPGPAQTHPHPKTVQNPTYVPPSTLPSITDNRVAPRTRLSLVLSSLAINLLLPFINGVMLGFGEIFAKDVVVRWFGWKTRRGSTAAGLGLRR
ncbi:hypothetical protein J3R82DRAFT_11923 [Butyriboletus roseoflavus]|nr:hypothetical protein J3R82DRAFT_11923 [Butyriboletus roseoflavus]